MGGLALSSYHAFEHVLLAAGKQILTSTSLLLGVPSTLRKIGLGSGARGELEQQNHQNWRHILP